MLTNFGWYLGHFYCYLTKLCIQFKSYGQYDTFVLTGNQTREAQPTGSNSSSVGYGSNVRSAFKALQCYSDFSYACATQWPVWTQAVVYLFNSQCFDIIHLNQICVCQFRGEPRSINTFVGSFPQGLNLLHYPWYLLFSWTPIFTSLPINLGLQLLYSAANYYKNRDREKSNVQALHSAGTTAPLIGQKGSFLSDVWLLLPSLLMLPENCLGVCMQENREKKGKKRKRKKPLLSTFTTPPAELRISPGALSV